ncbi:MAG: hypothetical protein V9F00_13265 [Nocardioides sp.]
MPLPSTRDLPDTGFARDVVLAHGIGGVQDLPLPRSMVILGAAVALVVSFVVLAAAWRTPRFARSEARPAPGAIAKVVDSTAFTLLARTFGLAVFGYAVMVAVLGEDAVTNPFFGLFYVFMWVAPTFLSALLGPFWRAVSPFRSINTMIARLSGGDPRRGVLDYPVRLGHWPAAAGLFAFVWMELAAPNNSELGPVRLWFACYVAAMLLGGVIFGDTFFERADPFEVYSTLIGRLSIWTRQDDRLMVIGPLASLARTPLHAGLTAVVAVLLGSTAFDSFTGSPWWIGWVQTHEFFGLKTLTLLAFCVIVALMIAGASMATPAREGVARRSLPNRFAHSVVPIVLGYIVAHYLTFFVHVGQSTLIQMSDPFGTGADWFGTADWQVNYWLAYHPRLVAIIKTAAVVTGHVFGVISAHDRALEVLPPTHQVRGQLPMLVVMVCFTVGGLYLLFAS